ncbi:hypothetical protein HDV00_009786 [Rhizophlyctis rosea]|nr:hypothetical protein HDV00_009786 [Rhizophlyctis rosea]
MRPTTLLLISSAALVASQPFPTPQNQTWQDYCGSTISTDASTFNNRCKTAYTNLTCATPLYDTFVDCAPSTAIVGAGLSICISCAGPLDIPAKVGGISPKVYNATLPANSTVQFPAGSVPYCPVFDQACKAACTLKDTLQWSWVTKCYVNRGAIFGTCMCTKDGSHPDIPEFSVVQFVDPSKVVQAPKPSPTPSPAGSGTGTVMQGSGGDVGMSRLGIGAMYVLALSVVAMM